MTAAVFSAQYGEIEVRFGNTRPAHSVYVRRRLAVALIVVALIVLIGVSTNTVLADRGAVPASSLAIRPGQSPDVAAAVVVGAAVASQTYIVQSGDTLWSIAESHHGDDSVGSYVDRLIDSNGGTSLQIGQALTLPLTGP